MHTLIKALLLKISPSGLDGNCASLAFVTAALLTSLMTSPGFCPEYTGILIPRVLEVQISAPLLGKPQGTRFIWLLQSATLNHNAPIRAPATG